MSTVVMVRFTKPNKETVIREVPDPDKAIDVAKYAASEGCTAVKAFIAEFTGTKEFADSIVTLYPNVPVHA